jgi:hypothetical protein
MGLYQDPANAANTAPTEDSTDAYRYDYQYNGAPQGQTYWGGDPNAADKDVARYRGLAQNPGQAPVQLDQTQANESRGLTLGALGALRAQAEGTAPSAAAIMSQRANEDAARAAARAGLHGVAGYRAAQPGIASQALAANASNAAQRGAELHRSAGEYAGAAGAINAGDIGAATANARLVAQQNALDQQRRQAYEQMAWNTRNAQLQGNEQAHQQIQNSLVSGANAANQEKAADWQHGKDLIGGGTGIVSSLFGFSDPRTKTCIGSLASMVRKAAR